MAGIKRDRKIASFIHIVVEDVCLIFMKSFPHTRSTPVKTSFFCQKQCSSLGKSLRTILHHARCYGTNIQPSSKNAGV